MPQSHETGPCNLCGSTQIQPVLSEGSIPIVQCARCSLVFLPPQQSALLEMPALGNLNYDQILHHLSDRVAPGKLLVIGSAMGLFVNFVKRVGWDRVECAVSPTSHAGKNFDACVLSSVLQRSPDPRRTMEEVWQTLQPGGLAYMILPNLESVESILLPEARYYFNAQSLSMLLTSIGFINIEDLTSAEISRSLVMCARKPWQPVDEAHQPSTQPWFEGWLVRRPGEAPDDQKVYFIENGRKRWVTTAEWIVAKGLRWPDDVQVITAPELDAIMPGPPLP